MSTLFLSPFSAAAAAAASTALAPSGGGTGTTRYEQRPQDYNLPLHSNPERRALARGDPQGVLDDGLKIIIDYAIDAIAAAERRKRCATKKTNVIGATVDSADGTKYGLLRIRKGSPMWTVAADALQNLLSDTLADQHPFAFTAFNGIEINEQLVRDGNNAAFRRLFRFLGLSSEEKDISTAGTTVGTMVSGRMQTWNNGCTNMYAGDRATLVLPDVRQEVREANRSMEPKLVKDYPKERYEAVFERLDVRKIAAWPEFALCKYFRLPQQKKQVNLLAAVRTQELDCDEEFALSMALFIKTVALSTVATLLESGAIANLDVAALRNMQSVDVLRSQAPANAPYAQQLQEFASALGIFGNGITASARAQRGGSGAQEALPRASVESFSFTDALVGRSVAAALPDKTLQERFSLQYLLGASVASAAAATTAQTARSTMFERKASTPETYTQDLLRVQRDGIQRALIAFEQAHQDVQSQVVGVCRTSSQGGVMAPLVLTL